MSLFRMEDGHKGEADYAVEAVWQHIEMFKGEPIGRCPVLAESG